jgi:NitT/TauT family transport system permease protein/taurine transport system permease protein
MSASNTWPRPSWSWASLPALGIVWCLAASQVPAYVLPQPWDVAIEAGRWIASGELWPQLGASLLRETGGFAAATIVSLAPGTAGALSSRFRDFISPLNSLFMAIPPIAWAPLSMIFFGIGYLSIAVVIFIAAVFPMAMTIQEGVLTIQGGEVRAARTLGASRLQLLSHIYLPASLQRGAARCFADWTDRLADGEPGFPTYRAPLRKLARTAMRHTRW